MVKRIVSILTAAMLLLGLVPAAFAKTAASAPVRDDLEDALNVEGGTLVFTSEGEYSWGVVSDSDSGRFYAQSGNAGVASSESTLSMTAEVESNMCIKFDFKAWGEGTSTAWDKCIFAMDGTRYFNYGALDNDWTEYVLNVPSGEHTFTWTYQKDGTTDPTGDYFAVDNVRFEEREPLPVNEELDAAVNAEGGTIHFYSFGDYPWFAETDETTGRVYGKSGNAGVNSSVSEMTAYVDLPSSGTVSFDFKAWGEGSKSERTIWDHCRFYVDGAVVLDYGAYDNDWEAFSYDLEAGEHELVWSYSKDGSMSNEGDCFAVDNVEIALNGEPMPIMIDTIEIEGFTVPAWGEHPDFEVSVPEDADYYIEYAGWLRDYEAMIQSDVFDIEGCPYTMTIVIEPNEGFEIAGDAEVTINGDASLVGSSGIIEDMFQVFSVAFTVEAPEPNYIDSVEILGFTAPEWGANPDLELSVPDGAHYSIALSDTYWDWYVPGGGVGMMTDTDVFDDPEAQYHLYLTIIPEDGWTVAEDFTVTINGGTEYVDMFGYHGGSMPYIYVNTICFQVEEPAESDL
ncbi:MAG: hypothetical protein IJM45_00340, partial [Clostridia bacterium]|nr:hypothetical protein [Clostridia bacterium]